VMVGATAGGPVEARTRRRPPPPSIVGDALFLGASGLSSNSGLSRNQYILSNDVRTVLLLQRDGNLVLVAGGRRLWQSGTANRDVRRATMQGDGNFVLTDSQARPVWATGTLFYPGSALTVQDDGNAVIYAPSNSGLVPVWSTNTHTSAGPLWVGTDRLPPNFALLPNTFLRSADRRFVLVPQGDGNLVLYGPGYNPLYSSNTSGRIPGLLAMQGDGNLVFYDYLGRPIWSAGSTGFPGTYFVVQSDGNAVEYFFGQPLFRTNTFGRV